MNRTRPRVRSGSAAIAAAILALAGVAGAGVGAAGATTAPGGAGVEGVADQPGVPRDPAVLVLEDFQNVPDRGASSLLSAYTGAAGHTYTADPYWLDPALCNGIVTSYTTSTPACVATNQYGYSADWNIRRLAHVLGQVQGMADPATNFAISAWTTSASEAETILPAGTEEFRTVTPFDVSVAGRFITLSIDVAEASCAFVGGANNSKLRFALVDGSVEHPMNGAPITACTDPKARSYEAPDIGEPAFYGWGDGGESVRAGRYVGDRSYLFAGDSLGVVLRNDTASDWGNDHAWDNIRMVDVTPQLHTRFEDPRVDARASTNLVFTLTNTGELASKEGWSFTDALSEGLVVAGEPSTDCGNGEVLAAPGGRTITASGDLASGDVSCTITVPVRAKAPGSYANCAANITSHAGIDLPECASVVFTEPGAGLGGGDPDPHTEDPHPEDPHTGDPLTDPAGPAARTPLPRADGADPDALARGGGARPNPGIAMGSGVLLLGGAGLALAAAARWRRARPGGRAGS